MRDLRKVFKKKKERKQGGGGQIYDNVKAYELVGIPVHFLEFVVLLIMHDSVTDNAFKLCLRL